MTSPETLRKLSERLQTVGHVVDIARHRASLARHDSSISPDDIVNELAINLDASCVFDGLCGAGADLDATPLRFKIAALNDADEIRQAALMLAVRAQAFGVTVMFADKPEQMAELAVDETPDGSISFSVFSGKGGSAPAHVGPCSMGFGIESSPFDSPQWRSEQVVRLFAAANQHGKCATTLTEAERYFDEMLARQRAKFPAEG